MKTIQTIKITIICFMLFLLIMLKNFLLQENAIVLLHLEALKEELVFHDLSYVLKHEQDIFFLFSIQNIKTNYYIINLKFFPVIFLWWKICSFLFISIYKKVQFLIFFQDFFLFLHDLMRLLQSIESIFFIDRISCCFCFLFNQ